VTSTLTDWPAADRRRPGRSSPTYAIRAPLAAWLRTEAEAAAGRRPHGYRVLDVGCGVKPYYPFFADGASEYVGVDVANPAADLEGTAERLPVPDAGFDVVLCTQVLEHTDDPAQAVRELRRVVAPGGHVLASTHGVQVYHPAPDDLWRWTHTGLERLFRENGAWSMLTVSPGSGTAACLGLLVSIYLDLLAKRAHARPLGRAFVAMTNVAAQTIDRRSRRLREPRPGALFANYHVRAVA
jgi:SAM-dependent methyltransferase